MTIFIDGLGRTISRDGRILENLLQRYRDTNLLILAQAGKEIEFLLAEIDELKKKATPKPVPVKPPAVKKKAE